MTRLALIKEINFNKLYYEKIDTFWVVILNGQDATTDSLRMLDNGWIQWLNGERIDDTSVNAHLCKLVSGRQSLVKSNSSTDKQDVVGSTLADNLGLSDLERLVVVINNGGVGTRCSDETNALGVGGQLDSSLGTDSVRRVENSGS